MGIRRVTIAFALTAALLCGQTHKHVRRRAAVRHSANRIVQPPFDASVVNNPNQPELKKDEKGSGVLRAQILLDRAHFSCGELDGDFGVNLEKTVKAFQEARHLPTTGEVDPPTWAALNSDQAPALTNYIISPSDETGPF